MSDKPTVVPRWANVGGAIETPASGKQDVGWVAEEKPAAQFSNWLLNLIYQWIAWLDSGFLTRPSLTDNTPVIAFTDQDGRARTYVDASGNMGGCGMREFYRWGPAGLTVAASQNDVAVAPGAQLTTSSDCVAAVLTGVEAHPELQLTVQDLATDPEAVFVYNAITGAANPAIIGDLDNVVVVLEYEAKLETVGANLVSSWGGLNDDADNNSSSTFADGTATAFVMFEKVTGATNWRCVVGNGTALGAVDSGVPPVANTYQTFRIEYHGLLTPVGVAATFAVARFFIDGTEVAEIATTDVPIAADSPNGFSVAFRNAATATGPAADLDFTIKRANMAWNTELAGDSPT